MWWFLKTQAEKQADLRKGFSKRQQEDYLLTLTPSLDERLGANDVALKVWLPQMVANAVKWMADYDGSGQSAWLRKLLVRYMYGSMASMGQQVRQRRARQREAFTLSHRTVRTGGRWVYLVPQLGKNTVAFKLWLPSQLRDDLQALAEHAQIGLSPFVREVVISELLGHGSLPERPQITGRPSAEAMAWERGDKVPVAQLEEAEFPGIGASVKTWIEH